MLYDPKWEKKHDRKFKGVTLSGFIAWLATKPADEEYDYTDYDRCPAAQYRASLGRKRLRVDFPPYGMTDFPGQWLQRIVLEHPWTFGAALTRARSMPSPNGIKS